MSDKGIAIDETDRSLDEARLRSALSALALIDAGEPHGDVSLTLTLSREELAQSAVDFRRHWVERKG